MENINFSEYLNKFQTETNYDKIMYLKIYVDNDSELREKYINYIKKHNEKIYNNIEYIDAGFDLMTPMQNDRQYEIFFSGEMVGKIDLKVKCKAILIDIHTEKSHNTGFYIYPRSSISKTSLRLANNTGIIDAGYRGNLIGMFDCIDEYTSIGLYNRLLQICAPSLVPIYVELVDTIEDLGENTIRGEGGFGSTGK